MDGDYKYEVRIHEGNPAYTKSKDIFRVARQRLGKDGKPDGSGWEYLDSNGQWHPQRNLKAGSKDGQANPSYNPDAARDTHIEKPEKIN
jgi:hypothetical protein